MSNNKKVMMGGGGTLCPPQAVTSQKKPGLDRVNLTGAWRLSSGLIHRYISRYPAGYQYVSLSGRFVSHRFGVGLASLQNRHPSGFVLQGTTAVTPPVDKERSRTFGAWRNSWIMSHQLLQTRFRRCPIYQPPILIL